MPIIIIIINIINNIQRKRRIPSRRRHELERLLLFFKVQEFVRVKVCTSRRVVPLVTFFTNDQTSKRRRLEYLSSTTTRTMTRRSHHQRLLWMLLVLVLAISAMGTRSSNSLWTTNQESLRPSTTATTTRNNTSTRPNVSTIVKHSQLRQSPSRFNSTTITTSTLAQSQRLLSSSSSSSLLQPSLPFGDLNLIVLTDVHSWVAGHGRKEPLYNANYGDVLSFYQRLQDWMLQQQQQQQQTTNPQQQQQQDDELNDCTDDTNRRRRRQQHLWLVVNGDWIDGTGLALNGDASYLIPILEKMPYDAVNIGNHELYDNAIIDSMTRPSGYTHWWGPKMLASNVRLAETNEPMGHKYHILHDVHDEETIHGASHSTNVLVFGFLYNMKDHDSHVVVEEVEHVLQEEWFDEVLRDGKELRSGGPVMDDAIVNEYGYFHYDAIVVMAHMHAKDELVSLILKKIREYDEHVPVQFITGHTHVREYVEMEDASTSFEAGRFLDTVGFVSFPTRTTLLKYKMGLIDKDGNPIQQPQDETVMLPNATNDSSALLAEPPKKPNTRDLFDYTFIDANTDHMKDILGVNTLDTPDGKALSKLIHETQESLGLLERVGCMKESYYKERKMTDKYSLWRLFKERVAPSQFPEDHVLLMGEEAWRYDLLGGGEMLLDDIVAVSPFNESFVMWPDIPAVKIDRLNHTMNENRTYDNYMLIPAAAPFHRVGRSYTLVFTTFHEEAVKEALLELDPSADVSAIQTMPLTTTQVWVKYFQKYHPDCSLLSTAGGFNPFGTGNYAASSDTLDKIRLAFAVIAVVVVFSLAAVYIRQRGIIFQRLTDQREHATLEAWQDYDSDYESDNEVVEPYRDYDNEEELGEEGEFI